MVMKLKDYVIRISPMAEISLEQMIKDFLNKKTCQACKHVCDVSAGLNHLGIYIFIEVDRSLKSGKILVKTSLTNLILNIQTQVLKKTREMGRRS